MKDKDNMSITDKANREYIEKLIDYPRVIRLENEVKELKERIRKLEEMIRLIDAMHEAGKEVNNA